MRYSAFVEANGLPFVRASSAPRVVYSAKNWTAGTSLSCLGLALSVG